MKLQAPSWFVYQPIWTTPDTYPIATALLAILLLVVALTGWAAIRARPRLAGLLVAAAAAAAALWLLVGALRTGPEPSWDSHHMPALPAGTGTLLDQALASEHVPTLHNVAPYLALRPRLAHRLVHLYSQEGADSLAVEQLQWIAGVTAVTVHPITDFPGKWTQGQLERLTPSPAKPVYWITPSQPVSRTVSILDLSPSLWVCEGCE